MCQRIIYNDTVIETVADFRKIFPKLKMVKCATFKRMAKYDCLCVLDIEATLKKAGFDYEIDGMDFVITRNFNENNKWISFIEQKPKQGQFIAAINRSAEDNDYETHLSWNAIGIWHNGEVWEGLNSLNGFTHWMPLPEPPKGV
jgi:hypothetical protein